MRVLYIAGELSGRAMTAAQVRAGALLPKLHTMTELRVICFPPEGRKAQFDGASVPSIKIQALARRSMSRAALALATLRRRPRSFQRLDTPEARLALKRMLLEHKPDIVHFDGFATLGLLDCVEENYPSAKIVAHIHDSQSARLRRYIRSGSLIDRLRSMREYNKALSFERKHLVRAASTIVDSPQDRDYLRNVMRSDAVETLPLGFDPSVFGPDGSVANLEQPAIVYSGSMKARQSIDAAVFLVRRVMPLVWARRADVRLYIVGGGADRGVGSLAERRVHVTGFVEDLASYLRSCCVYVCPLRLGSGMRTRVVEALACGAKVVASEMAVRGLTVPDEGAPWNIAETAEEFSDQILCNINGAYPDLGKRAAVYARTSYAWDNIASRLIEIYRGCKQR